MECLKCGGTGITLNNIDCDCGAVAQVEETLSPIEKYIPELYREQSSIVGLNEVIVGAVNQLNLQDIINNLVEIMPRHPSLFIDLSSSQVGAYEVYYALLEKIILKHGDLSKPVKEMFWVNELNIPRMQKSEQGVGSGMEYNYNYIISDFSITKYERLSEFVKVFKLKDISKMKPYPLNMYHLVIKSTGGF